MELYTGNVIIYYDNSYYIVELLNYVRYKIGIYNEGRVKKHYKNLKNICSKFGLEFRGYRGGDIKIYDEINPIKIYRANIKNEELEFKEVDNYKGEPIYVTNSFIK
ncbi:hypothetical protein [Methanocaldococcus sp.]